MREPWTQRELREILARAEKLPKPTMNPPRPPLEARENERVDPPSSANTSKHRRGGEMGIPLLLTILLVVVVAVLLVRR